MQESLTSLTNFFKSSGASSNTILNSDITDITSSLNKTTSLFDPKDLVKNSTLGSVTTESDTAKQVAQKNFDELAKSLAGQTNTGAISPAVSFVTSSSRQVVEDATISSLTSGLNISDLTTSQQSKLQSFAGVSDLTDTTKVQDNFNAALSDSMLTGVNSNGLLHGFMASGDVGLNQLAPLPTTTNSDTGFSLGNTLSKVKSYLPDGLTSTLGVATGLTDSQLTGRLSTLTSKLSSVSDLNSQVGNILGLGGNYPEITDSNGNVVYGYANSGADYNSVNSLYRDARSLCSELNLANLLAYANMKDLFDLLLAALLGKGMAQLINQLINCGNYFDNRSSYIMTSSIPRVSQSGDIFTLNSIKGAVGRSAYSNPTYTARTTAANMSYNSHSDSEMSDYLSDYGLTKHDLVTDSNGPTGTISTEYVGYLSSKDTGFVDSFMDTDTRNTALTFLTGW